MLRGDAQPNQTIYINNLNEKIKKEELKKSLYAVFSQFGKILDIIALKTLKLRGQAWVVFDGITAATNALRQMQGFPFYEKPMKISYARTKSDVIAKADGTFIPRGEKKKKGSDARKKAQQQPQPPPVAAVDPPAGGPLPPAPASAPGLSEAAAAPSQMPPPPFGMPLAPEAPAPPNNTLFVRNLPHEASPAMLQLLFQQFPAFQEVRLVPARPGIAFVEFAEESAATIALQGLQGFHITATNPMQITYANK
eukprot:TRINITY_DN6737_c0_g2_i1.p1 TRINITY_DN6737_c0_g2~~TRINITY_DN6737_c0_g2_i1.p1  ORF type:complete len:252 (-),score=80.01 TRINITY_DN6737_c0_g2_i1:1615-2370(-)